MNPDRGYARTRGDVVIIHGMCCTPRMWTAFAQKLERAGLSVYVPPLRGHNVEPGAEPPENVGRLSLLDYAADIEAFVKGLGRPPVLIGHSMGGLLALMIAARQEVQAAVLIAPAPPAGVLAVSVNHIPMALAMLARWAFWRKPIRPSFREARWALLNRLSDLEARQVHSEFVYESGRALFEIAAWPLDRAGASRVNAKDVRCPMLMLSGSDDRVTPPSVIRRIASRYEPRADFEELPRHAHWMIGEPGWERIADRIAAWIGSQSCKPSAVGA